MGRRRRRHPIRVEGLGFKVEGLGFGRVCTIDPGQSSPPLLYPHQARHSHTPRGRAPQRRQSAMHFQSPVRHPRLSPRHFRRRQIRRSRPRRPLPSREVVVRVLVVLEIRARVLLEVADEAWLKARVHSRDCEARRLESIGQLVGESWVRIPDADAREAIASLQVEVEKPRRVQVDSPERVAAVQLDVGEMVARKGNAIECPQLVAFEAIELRRLVQHDLERYRVTIEVVYRNVRQVRDGEVECAGVVNVLHLHAPQVRGEFLIQRNCVERTVDQLQFLELRKLHAKPRIEVFVEKTARSDGQRCEVGLKEVRRFSLVSRCRLPV